MPAEKKKLLILGVLALVILCVGAFSLKGGHSAPAPKPAASGGKHRHHGSADPSAAPTATSPAETSLAKPGPSTGPVNEVEAGAKPGNLTSTAPVGTPSSSGTPSGSVNGSTVASAPVSEQDFPERDPFDGRKFIPPDPKATPPPAAAPKSTGGAPKLGKIPPLEVTQIDKTGTLPPAGGPKTALVGLNEKSQPPKEEEFSYSVSGVITGDRSAAVFVDSKGNQRLISLGGSIDGDATVVGITQSKVTVNSTERNEPYRWEQTPQRRNDEQ